MSDYPPRTAYADQVRAVVDSFSAVVPESDAVYLSASFTTGWRRVALHSRLGRPLDDSNSDDAKMLVRDVIDPNREDAAQLARSMRERFTGQVVIDPTALKDQPGWKQNDYRDLWGQVIERHANIAVFAEGWQASCGCSYEFLVAKRAGVKTLDNEFQSLDLNSGIDLMRGSIDERWQDPEDRAFLSEVLSELAQPMSSSCDAS